MHIVLRVIKNWAFFFKKKKLSLYFWFIIPVEILEYEQVCKFKLLYVIREGKLKWKKINLKKGVNGSINY